MFLMRIIRRQSWTWAFLDRGESNKAIILVDNDTNSIDIGGPLEDENVRV